MDFYELISERFFSKEWSDYTGHWDFRELLRYLSDRNIEIHIDKGSLWIETDKENIEILLYYPMDDEEQKWECEKLYNTFVRWEEKTQKTLQDIKLWISNSKH